MGLAVRLGFVLAGAVLVTLIWIDRLGGPGDRPIPPVARQHASLRIVALGTSLTHRAFWPEQLAQRLQACMPRGVTAEVMRVARPGARSDWGLAQADAIAQTRPDLVIIELAMNDADLHDGLWPWQSHANHRALITRIRAQSPATGFVLLTSNPVSGWQKLVRPFLPLYQRLYGDLADNEGAGLVDGFGRWKQQGDLAALAGDGVHPDPAAEADLLVGPLTDEISLAFAMRCK
jgi:lysophospholipase L1-like esterase